MCRSFPDCLPPTRPLLTDGSFRIHNATCLMARDEVLKDRQDRETEMRKARRIVELFPPVLCTKVESRLEKEINVLPVQLSPFRRLLPSYISPTTPPALPGAFAASAATMTAVLSPTDAFRRSILPQDDTPCVNRYLSLSLIFPSSFSAL